MAGHSRASGHHSCCPRLCKSPHGDPCGRHYSTRRHVAGVVEWWRPLRSPWGGVGPLGRGLTSNGVNLCLWCRSRWPLSTSSVEHVPILEPGGPNLLLRLSLVIGRRDQGDGSFDLHQHDTVDGALRSALPIKREPLLKDGSLFV